MINLELLLEMAWCSDWNGYEVGFDQSEVVGLYQRTINHEEETEVMLNAYIDMETRKVLEIWTSEI